MDINIDAAIARIREIEEDLRATIEAQKARFKYDVKERRIRFEDAVLRRHRALRTGLVRYLFSTRVPSILAAPVVYGLIVPLVLTDLSVSVFQAICFPVYGIRKVPRGDFVAIDRHHLAYLNPIEKLNCAYCGYANGVLAYARTVAGRSEEHWCPIKHARRTQGEHPAYWNFAGYGDAEDFARKTAQAAARADAVRARRWDIGKETE